MIELIPRSKPVTISYRVDENGLNTFQKNEVFGPSKVQVSLNLVFVTDDQIHTFSDRDSIFSGEIEIYQPSCKKNITIKIPEGYFVNQIPPPIKTINPCGINKTVDFNVDLSGMNIHQSTALQNKSSYFLNAYPTVPHGEDVSIQLNLHIHPVPSLFY